MIELTTGVIFLVSSLYAVGLPAQVGQAQQPQMTIQTAEPIVATSTIIVATSTASSFTDSKTVEAYLRKEYVDTPILVEVARCESTFRQYNTEGNVIRGKVNSADVGVMQINEKYHSDQALKLGYNIYTVEGNVDYAKYLHAKFGLQPWSSSSSCWSHHELELARN